jgi:hypothetical protein
MRTAETDIRKRAGLCPGSLACPVCRAPAPTRFLNVEGRTYLRCDSCEARFLDARQRLQAADEYAYYRQHENDPDDPAYRQFLGRLADPLLTRMDSRLSGLDYGCGPGPALAAMLCEAGHRMVLYDPFFRSDPKPLAGTYDFIVCAEVAEHFHHPADEFDRLDAMLRPGAWLGVLTCFQTDDARFSQWHYRRDPTHVVFYRETTLRRIAIERGWDCEIPAKDVALMRKPETTELDR